MEIVATSHTGLLRRRNEDCVAVDESLGIAVLADGMGGLRDGHLASRLAVDAVLGHLRRQPRPGPDGFAPVTLEQALGAANDEVCRSAGLGVMGTTALVASLGAGGAGLAHVGDSRAYLWHRGALSQLTRDHSLVQDMVDQGLLRAEQARHAPNRNVVTRAVGLDSTLVPDSRRLPLEAGDVLLLCSDGLWEMLDDTDMAELLAPGPDVAADLEQAARALVDAANAAGGHDNVSVVLMRR